MFRGKTEFLHDEIERNIKDFEWGDYSEVEELLILDLAKKRKMLYKPPIPKKSNPVHVHFPSDIETGEPHWKTAKTILRVRISED